jgi:hypothetical protein
MKNLSKIYDKIQAIYDSLDDLIGELEEKRDAIEEKAIDKGRDMTEKEQERFDDIVVQINAIEECKDNLDYAMSAIDEYCEE